MYIFYFLIEMYCVCIYIYIYAYLSTVSLNTSIRSIKYQFIQIMEKAKKKKVIQIRKNNQPNSEDFKGIKIEEFVQL